VAATGSGDAQEAVVHLRALAGDLERRGYTVRSAEANDKAGLIVAHRTAPDLSETIRAAQGTDGGWWFWWSWGDPIAPVTDIDAAGFKIAYVLTPQAHN
jgi:hypothetical protein